MFDFRNTVKTAHDKIRLAADLFGVRRQRESNVILPERQAGFADHEILKALGWIPGVGLSSRAVINPPQDLPADIRSRLLDRVFDRLDKDNVPIQQQYDWIITNCPALIPQRIGGGIEKLYIVFNGAVPTTAAQVKMACTTSINTLVQVLAPSTTTITILEWGISFDASAAAVPVNCEFFSNDVAATAGTAVTPTIFGTDATASLCVGGTGSTMFNDGAITEGTVANARMYDCQLVAPTGAYWKQWPLGREPTMAVSKALRIRVTAPAAVNAICYIVWSE